MNRQRKFKIPGKVTRKNGSIQMVSPTFDDEGANKNTGKIVPIYPLTYSLSRKCY